MSLVIDPLRFAKKGDTISGSLDSFSRLVDDIISGGRVDYKLVGTGRVGEYALELTLSGQISAICQRCLEPMEQEVDVVRRYRLVPESQIDDAIDEDMLMDEETELLPINYPIQLTDLIEDELLLSLPTVPKHDNCEIIVSN